MKLGQAMKMAVRSIGASKARTALTMLGIIIGVASVVIMVSVVQGSNKKQLEYFERMGNNRISVDIFSSMMITETADGTTVALSPGPVKDIGRLLYDYCARYPKLITGVTPQGNISGSVVSGLRNSDKMENGTPNISLGNEKFSVCNNFQIARGRDISYLDVKEYKQVVVLGAALAKYLFQFSNPVGKSVTIAGHPFTVIGVYAAKDPNSQYSMDNMAVVPESVNRTLNKNEPITNYIVKTRSTSANQRVISDLNRFLKRELKEGNFNVNSDNQFLDESKEQNRMMSLVLGGIAGISLLVGGIGIMNIVLVTVSERTREIGVRRAIGAPRASIMAQFLVESAVVCGAGGVIGIGLGVLGSLTAGRLLLKMLLFPDAGLALGAFLFSVLLGIGFGLYPAAKASGLTPVEALRTE